MLTLVFMMQLGVADGPTAAPAAVMDEEGMIVVSAYRLPVSEGVSRAVPEDRMFGPAGRRRERRICVAAL